MDYCDIEWFALEKNRNHSAVTPQGTDPDLPVSVQESPVEVRVGGGLLAGLGALSVAVGAWGLLKKVTIIFITSSIVWPQVE